MTHVVILRSDYQRELAKDLITRAPLGYVVTIREQTRTGAQNGKMWAQLRDVSMAKPEGRRLTPDVWKAVFMHSCGHEVQFEMGLDGKPFPLGFRSSALSVSEMSELIEFINAYGAQHGVVFKDDAR